MSSEEARADRASRQAFAIRVLAAFEAAGHHTDAAVVAAGGPSTTTLTKLRKTKQGQADMAEPRNDTFGRIDTAARWAPGSARALWRDAGFDPQPATAATSPWDLEDVDGLELVAAGAPISARDIESLLQRLAIEVVELRRDVDHLQRRASGGARVHRDPHQDQELALVEPRAARDLGAATPAQQERQRLDRVGEESQATDDENPR